MNTELLTKLRDLRIGIFPNIETVNAVLDECIKLAGEQTEVEPVAWLIPSVWQGMHSQVTRDKQVADAVKINGGETTPLYAHPPKPSGLSDEEIKRILNANTYEDLNDSRQGGYVTSSDHDAYDMGMLAGLRYARDHGYLSKEA